MYTTYSNNQLRMVICQLTPSTRLCTTASASAAPSPTASNGRGPGPASLAIAPDVVLVLVTANAEVIRRRMAAEPRDTTLLKEQDVERILGRFQEEYDDSLLEHRFTIDTTDATVEGAFQEFLSKMEPHLSEVDRRRLGSESGA